MKCILRTTLCLAFAASVGTDLGAQVPLPGYDLEVLASGLNGPAGNLKMPCTT